MAHHHLATVVKFKADALSVIIEEPKFHCLYRIKVLSSLLPLTEAAFIFSGDGKFNDSKEEDYLLADFFYMEGDSKVRCKVLCPFTDKTNWMKISDNFYIVRAETYGFGGNHSCTPPRSAFVVNNESYSQDKIIKDYIPMYCLTDELNPLLAPYFAFVKVKSKFDPSKGYGHNDNPVEEIINEVCIPKEFLSHINSIKI
jgi:hypothetical protein